MQTIKELNVATSFRQFILYTTIFHQDSNVSFNQYVAMGWIIVQIPELFCFLLRTRRLFRFFFLFICLLLYCEFFHYFIVLLFCKWPVLDVDTLQAPSKSNPLKVMIIADTHILGWREGHWFDKLRRYGEIFANDS